MGISEPSQKSIGPASKSTPERENSVLNAADSAVFRHRPALTAFGQRLFSTKSCAAKVGRDRLLLLEDAAVDERVNGAADQSFASMVKRPKLGPLMAGARLIAPRISTTTARHSQLLLEQEEHMPDNELVHESEGDVSSTFQNVH